MARYNTYIGIDLGGGKSKNTGVALLRAGEGAEGVRVCYVGTKDPTGKPFYDDCLIHFVSTHGANAVVAIDAPLTLTACVRCRRETCPGVDGCEDIAVRWFRERGDAMVRRERTVRRSDKPTNTPYTQRVCELILQHRLGVIPRETLGQGMGPLTARAHHLHRALGGSFTLGENLIEVSPKATVQLLFGERAASRYKREVDTWETRARILEDLADTMRFEVWREGCLSNDHCFDAVLCAYTAYLWDREDWTIDAEDEFEEQVLAEDGWIWVPPAPPSSD